MKTEANASQTGFQPIVVSGIIVRRRMQIEAPRPSKARNPPRPEKAKRREQISITIPITEVIRKESAIENCIEPLLKTSQIRR